MNKKDRPNAPNASSPIDTARRTFLGATLAAPALVVATPEAPPITITASPLEDGAVEGRGYHTTEHIRTYYRLARF